MPQTLQAKVAFLSQPSSYRDQTTSVETIETHMSWVFLTDLFAYKLKKPAVYDHLDFRNLDARRHNCEEEVRLNSRLAGNVYLGVLPLVMNAGGTMQWSGEGEVVEWVIRMRRLPARLALDQCVRNQNIPAQPFARLAEKLSRFYLGCRPEPLTAREYRDRFDRDIVDVIAELAPEEYAMPMDIVQAVFRKMNAFMHEHADMLEMRASEGRIVDGHGDLRAEHVYLETEPMIVDCLEFSKTLRTVDAAFDMAFLALECERLGASQEGDALMKRYCAITGDAPAPVLIHFYKTYHACSRARLALWHLKEAQYRGDPKWQRQAKEWLLLAQRHAAQVSRLE